MIHAFTNYSQFRNLPKTDIILRSGRPAILERCEPDPYSIFVRMNGVAWGLKLTVENTEFIKWFTEDGQGVNTAGIISGKMVDAALKIISA